MLHRNAIRAYQQAEQDFFVDGADAHGLVEILYRELISALERAEAAIAAKDYALRAQEVTRALTIIYVLGSSLDFEKGGEVAVSLGQFYEWARVNVIEASRVASAERLETVRKAVADIADAWRSIANRAE
ncbi:MAG: flagellar export chaperone FliS [Beijerinckiaceae bacterium]|nr:flagellar export chaperone FliS [Beijerinckiaceae bacterium]